MAEKVAPTHFGPSTDIRGRFAVWPTRSRRYAESELTFLSWRTSRHGTCPWTDVRSIILRKLWPLHQPLRIRRHANGKPGDQPLTDLLSHGTHPFPEDIEEMVRRFAIVDPMLLREIDQYVFQWEVGYQLDEGRAKLKELLAKAKPNPILGDRWPV
jgi:hypothetical protein